VVDQLAHDQIQVLAVYDTTFGQRDKAYLKQAIHGFEYAASRTGGTTRPISTAEEVAEGIRAGLREVYRPVPRLDATQGYAAWAQCSSARKIGTGGHRFAFDVALATPSGTKDGVYCFPLIAHLEDGSEIGRSQVIIRIGLANLDWRPILVPL